MPTPPPQSSPIETLASITFGAGGNSLPNQRHGFGDPEDGFTWSLGKSSELVLHAPPPPAGLACEHLLELQLAPFVPPDRDGSQLLAVAVNGVDVGLDHLFGEGTVAYPIPARALRPDGRLRLQLRHPEAASPKSFGIGADDRNLGFMHRTIAVLRRPPPRLVDMIALPPFAVPTARDEMGRVITAATGLDPRGLVQCFESLGHNCEFGIVQRHLGAEPLGMLRFPSITLDDLLAGLRSGFAGVGEDVTVSTHPTGDGRHEYMVHDNRYGMSQHTFRTTDTSAEADVCAEHTTHLRFMHRRFTRWLRTGERLFIFQRPGQITPSQARPLLALLQSYGPNSLLYVDQNPDLPNGIVEQLGAGLYHGKLDKLAPLDDVGDSDLGSWLSVCVNAWRLWEFSKAASR